MQKFLIVFFSAIILNASVKAQGKAEYKHKFTEGNYLLLEGNYTLALKNFLEAYAIDSTNANINYKVGLCYINTETEKSKALHYLEKAVTNISKNYDEVEPTQKSASIFAYYYYGQALHFNYKFDEAIANYEKFKSFLSPKRNLDDIKDVDRQIEISNNAKALVAAPINIILKNMGDSINSSYPEYSPVLSADENTLIFTSRRPGSTGGDKTDDGQFYEDIYISYRKNDSTWTTPVSISPNINTTTHEACVGLTADAQTLLIYKDSNGGDIYYSTLDGNNWTFPQAMGSDINSSKWETSACLSPDGNTLYFVSDRPGGLGGRDIWKCVKLPNGKWSLAVNLGAPVNTPYDEESPFIHPSGNVLFFSSKGHQSIGGFDIFFSSKGEDNKWEEPINIGYPINTTDDDVFYVTSPDGKRGYYSSSSRPEGYGEKDIYMVSIPERKEQPLVLIKGYILPAEGQQMPPNIEIVATNNETGIVSGVYKPMMRDGSFTIIIPPGSNYTLSYQNDGQEFYSEIIEVPLSAAYQEINKEVRLKGVNLGLPVTNNAGGDTTKTGVANTDRVTGAKDQKDTKGTKGSKGTAITKSANPAHDDISFISVTGRMLDDKSPPTGIPNFKVNLLNSKGEVVQTTTTDSLGWFIFTNLPPDENYVVALDSDDDISVNKKSTIEIKDQGGNPVKIKKDGNKYKYGKNSVSIKTGQYKKTDVKPVAAPHEQLAKTDKLYFEMYFRYNVTQTDVNDTPFKEFIENLAALYKAKGTINLSIISSASMVPTKAYPTNKALSIARNDKMKEQIISALKEKGIPEEKIIITKFKSFVDGPQYQHDFLINKAAYEKYQFVKVNAN